MTLQTNWQLYRRYWYWQRLYSPRGVIGFIGILMGLGRLFQVGLTATLIFGPSLLLLWRC